jgi:hypothetical protein
MAPSSEDKAATHCGWDDQLDRFECSMRSCFVDVGCYWTPFALLIEI